MLAAILSIIAYLLPIIYESWVDGGPARAKEKADEECQDLRSRLASGDASPAVIVLDGLLAPGASGDAGGQGDPDETGIRAGLLDFNISVGEAPGGSKEG